MEFCFEWCLFIPYHLASLEVHSSLGLNLGSLVAFVVFLQNAFDVELFLPVPGSKESLGQSASTSGGNVNPLASPSQRSLYSITIGRLKKKKSADVVDPGTKSQN